MTDSKQLVGKYEIERKLGEGGFGIVYKANDTTLDRAVALKQLRAELSSSPEALERFKQESRSMGGLNQTSIIKVLEVFEDSGRYFIAMDYMPNGSLADKLKGGTSLSVEKTVEILKPIARAIDYAHGKNLLHRDIKPSNILFTEDDEPVLSDFGLVKSLLNQGLTTTGSTFGTPEYMAPEQILGRELTPSADLYSLGVVAYQMLTGNVPFQGNTPYEIQENHVHTPPPDIVAINAALPAEFTGIFAKILAKKPGERYATAREFIQELDKKVSAIKQEQSFEKMKQAQSLIDAKDFPAAITLLKELISANPDPGLRETLKEIERRKEICGEYQEIKENIARQNEKLEALRSQETWLVSNNHLSNNVASKPIQRKGFRNWLASEGEEDSDAETISTESNDLDSHEDQQGTSNYRLIAGWLFIIAGLTFLFIGIFVGYPLYWIIGIFGGIFGILFLNKSKESLNSGQDE